MLRSPRVRTVLRTGVAVAALSVALTTGATEAFAQGGVGLLAKPLDEMARPANPLQGLPQGAQNMAQNFANGGAPPAASERSSSSAQRAMIWLCIAPARKMLAVNAAAL